VSTVVIVDSGGANLASLRYALQRLGAQAEVSCDAGTIRNADRVLLPGVGAAAAAMRRLRALDLVSVIRTLTQPVLGVCLGMQLLFERSEEGRTECLGLLPDSVRSIAPRPGLPVPHMGWNTLQDIKSDPLLEGINPGSYAYFVHSFGVRVTQGTLASAEYGTHIAAVVRERNFWGTQFHPERSSATGARILHNFLRIQRCS
jgi:imidazole glycerol-phosphate synthase subunit HisH